MYAIHCTCYSSSNNLGDDAWSVKSLDFLIDGSSADWALWLLQSVIICCVFEQHFFCNFYHALYFLNEPTLLACVLMLV